MDSIILSAYEPKTKIIDEKPHIYDCIRKNYFVLTPEEMVRQAFVNYLINHLGYPKALIAVERELKIGAKLNRSDIRILDRAGECFMLIECKSFKTKVNQQTFDQAARYSKNLNADYLVVTNGVTTLCCHMDYGQESVSFLEQLPKYPDD